MFPGLVPELGDTVFRYYIRRKGRQQTNQQMHDIMIDRNSLSGKKRSRQVKGTGGGGGRRHTLV